jgi:CheY-like chemotaxis protein
MSKKRLLVIEDDIDVSEMLIHYFTSQGYEVISAMSGDEGITLARAKSPNLILLDVMLPDMDGFDVCKSLRTTALTKYIPITFLTQRDRRADKVAGLELGADDYVTKPFDMEELRLRVAGSLRRSSRESLHDVRTGLPTKVLVEDRRMELEDKAGVTELRIEIIGFTPFRDMYGFVAGDEALTFAGSVISEVIAEKGTAEDFAGALSDDHYVLFTFTNDVNTLIQSLTSKFSEGAKAFYNFMDTDRGYVLINEAQDNEQHIPLMHFKIHRVQKRTPLSNPQPMK